MTVVPSTRPPLSTNACPSCGAEVVPGGRFCPSCGHELTTLVAPAEQPLADPLVGRVIADRYRILNLLGRGGMGVVYKVEHVHIGKLMAMKLLHGELARERGVQKRFRREAEAASHLNHPNTVQIFDFGSDEGLMYLVMEYVAGQDFGQLIQQDGPLDFARVCRICSQICDSVGQAHARGIVHRDLKPENVMIVDGRSDVELVKVLDFGLAKLRDQDASATLTQAGSIVGTPYYMAPEQIRGEDTDQRGDVYALGALMYKALAGVPPFTAPTPVGVLTRHLSDEVVPPSRRLDDGSIPEAADQIILHAMQKRAEDRFQNMDELRVALSAYLASVGELEPSLSFRFPSGASFLSPSGNRKVIEVATRGDIDHYETRLRRRGWLGMIAAALFAALFLAGGVWFALLPKPQIVADGTEQEPNEKPEDAMLLVRGRAFRGFIGKRQDRSSSDADVWQVDHERHSAPNASDTNAATIGVSGIPNMDIALDIVKAGVSVPELIVNSGGVGQPERAPNYPLVGSKYFLRVREVGVSGVMPTENVSDPYEIRWDYHDVRLGSADDEVDGVQPDGGSTMSPDLLASDGLPFEHEFNDSLERAEVIEGAQGRRGYLGWAGDVDTFCTAGAVGKLDVVVSAIPKVDLVLRWVDQAQTRSRKINEASVGEGESATLRPREPQRLCVELSANRLAGGRANADHPYILTMRSEEP